MSVACIAYGVEGRETFLSKSKHAASAFPRFHSWIKGTLPLNPSLTPRDPSNLWFVYLAASETTEAIHDQQFGKF